MAIPRTVPPRGDPPRPPGRSGGPHARPRARTRPFQLDCGARLMLCQTQKARRYPKSSD